MRNSGQDCSESRGFSLTWGEQLMRDVETHLRLVREAWGVATGIAGFNHFETGFNQGTTGHYANHTEALELLLACCVYARSALEHQVCLNEGVARGFHDKKVRDTTYEDWRLVVGDNSAPPLLRYEHGVGENFRNMHLGSISFRLPTAVWLVHRIVPTCPFCKADNGIDWKRDFLYRYPLERAKDWGCCHEPRNMDDEQGLLSCLAMVLGHRDLYGHGQEPIQSKGKREMVMDIPYCRLSLAQLHLIRRTLNDLKSAYERSLF